MNARASDSMYWTPVGRPVLTSSGSYITLAHWCPFAVVQAVTRRDCLDPMALGTCRYCEQPLPGGDAA